MPLNLGSFWRFGRCLESTLNRPSASNLQSVEIIVRYLCRERRPQPSAGVNCYLFNLRNYAMPSGICIGCNRVTNSTLSNWWFTDTFDHATECYASFVDGRWVKGCAYDKLDRSNKYSPIHLADQVINRR